MGGMNSSGNENVTGGYSGQADYTSKETGLAIQSNVTTRQVIDGGEVVGALLSLQEKASAHRGSKRQSRREVELSSDPMVNDLDIMSFSTELYGRVKDMNLSPEELQIVRNRMGKKPKPIYPRLNMTTDKSTLTKHKELWELVSQEYDSISILTPRTLIVNGQIMGTVTPNIHRMIEALLRTEGRSQEETRVLQDALKVMMYYLTYNKVASRETMCRITKGLDKFIKQVVAYERSSGKTNKKKGKHT